MLPLRQALDALVECGNVALHGRRVGLPPILHLGNRLLDAAEQPLGLPGGILDGREAGGKGRCLQVQSRQILQARRDGRQVGRYALQILQLRVQVGDGLGIVGRQSRQGRRQLGLGLGGCLEIGPDNLGPGGGSIQRLGIDPAGHPLGLLQPFQHRPPGPTPTPRSGSRTRGLGRPRRDVAPHRPLDPPQPFRDGRLRCRTCRRGWTDVARGRGGV
mmetsp:Transcript_13242/g.37781  ORF Transcript_13242/g.37781 Transcript_13242/m.37781 type:complete len:216 (-) Transcript_13242:805-1452(-)